MQQSMHNIFVDPVIVTTPSQQATKADVEVWLQNLSVWLKEALSGSRLWLHAIQATDLLIEHNRFPSFETLRVLQRRYQLNINLSQIVRDVDTFFRDEQLDLKGQLEVLGYIVEVQDGSILIYPEHLSARWLDVIREDMLQIFVTACACKCTNHLFTNGLQIATLKLPDNTKEITVSAIVIDALPELILDTNSRIVQKFPLLFTPDDIELPDIASLWSQGEIGVRKAIAQHYKQHWENVSAQSLKYELGTHFIESVIGRNDMTDTLLNQIVRTMARVIADKAREGKNRRHEVRERDEQFTPQLVRLSDGAKAWRLTVSPDGAAWRVHYWQISNTERGEVIEFSNVLTKHDPTIMY